MTNNWMAELIPDEAPSRMQAEADDLTCQCCKAKDKEIKKLKDELSSKEAKLNRRINALLDNLASLAL